MQKRDFMKKVKKVKMEKIESMALQGKDVNKYYTKGSKVEPLKGIQRVNVDFSSPMLKRLDEMANDLNISRQAVIKSLLLFALNEHAPEAKGKKASGQ